MSNCLDCRRLEGNLGFARNDFGDLRGKLRRAREDDAPAMAERLRLVAAEVREREVELEAHYAEAAHGGEPRAHARIAELAKPKLEAEIPEGKARCVCGKVIAISGVRLHRHKDKSGMPCPNLRIPGRRIEIGQLPPPQPLHLDRAAPVSEKGKCRECGKWLPGERSLCGRCSVLRSA